MDWNTTGDAIPDPWLRLSAEKELEVKMCKGGDIIFAPGKGEGTKIGGVDGSIKFLLADNTEVLRFDPNGDALVRGQIVDTNVGVYQAFCEWLRTATVHPS